MSTRRFCARPSGVSFVDQVSFAVIEREGIHIVLVLDSDFARPGVTVLPTAQA